MGFTESSRQTGGYRNCRLDEAKAVPGEGSHNTKIMLIGQNPGTEEDKQGRPFVGRAGEYLDEILKKNNINREELFITNVVKYKTPGNRKPTVQEIRDCMPFLVEEIKQIKPRVVVLMGEVAWKTPRLEGIKCIEPYHPAAAMRFPRVRGKFEEDFRKLGKHTK